MNINRNNYEEYFLLYADNELSKTEKKVVEIFVQENIDLKEEFLMIQLTVNTPTDEIKLTDKSFLLKKESPFINENNYEDIFVLYHDNELSNEQRAATEKFIAENSGFKTNFELIGKAKLIADNSVVYPGKKQLYKKEKSGIVIPMILWRSLAAAVFLGFGLWIAVPYFNKNQVSHPVATATNDNLQKPGAKETKKDTSLFHDKPVKEENTIATAPGPTEHSGIKKNGTKIETSVLKEQKIKEEAIASNDIKTKDERVEQKINTRKPDTDYHLAASDKPVKELPAIIEKTETQVADNQIVMQANKIEPDAPNIMHAQTVSYYPDAGANNQNYVFYDVPAEEFRKSKVGGFLKKVKRMVERNNPITRLFAGDEGQVAAK